MQGLKLGLDLHLQSMPTSVTGWSGWRNHRGLLPPRYDTPSQASRGVCQRQTHPLVPQSPPHHPTPPVTVAQNALQVSQHSETLQHTHTQHHRQCNRGARATHGSRTLEAGRSHRKEATEVRFTLTKARVVSCPSSTNPFSSIYIHTHKDRGEGWVGAHNNQTHTRKCDSTSPVGTQVPSSGTGGGGEVGGARVVHAHERT